MSTRMIVILEIQIRNISDLFYSFMLKLIAQKINNSPVIEPCSASNKTFSLIPANITTRFTTCSIVIGFRFKKKVVRLYII